MSESTLHRLLLAAIAGLVFFLNLGGSHLWDIDETIFSQAAAEMYQRGDFVVPYFNGELFPDKPALSYWLMISAYQLFGVGEFAARFWSAILSVGSVLLTYGIGRRLFSPAVGLWAGLILATNISFDVIARAATPDASLIFFTTLAISLFARCAPRVVTNNNHHTPGTAPPRETDLLIEPTWRDFALAYAAMGVAMMAKGPVGVVLPTTVFGLFFLTTRGANTLAGLPAVSAGQGRFAPVAKLLDATLRTASPRHIFQTILSLRPFLAVLMVLLVAGPWYLWVGLRTDWQWPQQFFGVHNFGRFLNAMDNHRGPIFYYALVVLAMFFPWSIVMWGTLTELVRQSARTMVGRQGAILIACWIAVYFCFFSLCSTKLPSYVVPMYPALAIATALFLDRWVRFPEFIPRSWPWIAYSILTLVGLGMLVGVPLVAARLLDGSQTLSSAALARVAPLGFVGLVPLIGGMLCLFFTWRCQARQSIRALGLTAVVFTVWLFGISVGQFDRFQTAPRFVAAIDSHATGEPHVSTFRYFRPSMVFYGHRPVGKLPQAADVARFFAEHPTDAFVYTVDEQMPELEKQLPGDVVILERQPRLFLSGQTLLLGRATATAAAGATPSR